MERTTAIAATDTLRIDFLEPAVAARTICVTFTERANKRLEGPGFGSAFLSQHEPDVWNVSGEATWMR